MADDFNAKFERNEVNLLINNGIAFSVKIDTEKTIKTYLFGLIKKKQREKQTKRFIIKEPTLATLDLLSKEWVELAVDDDILTDSDKALNSAKIYVKRNLKRVAKIIAIAVLNEDYFICQTVGNQVKYKTNETELNNLTNLFLLYIKPSDLLVIYKAINVTSNISDFITAIRLMSADRTTKPQRIADVKS